MYHADLGLLTSLPEFRDVNRVLNAVLSRLTIGGSYDKLSMAWSRPPEPHVNRSDSGDKRFRDEPMDAAKVD